MARPDARYIGQFRPEFSRLHQDRDLYWVVPFSVPLVLAVVGPRFGGVTSTLRYLTERHGFRLYTLGGELRRIAEQRGVAIESRRYLQDLGDELRAEHRDAGYLARGVGRRLRSDRIAAPSPAGRPVKIAIGGIKHPRELVELQKIRGFRLAIVGADEAHTYVRFRRVLDIGMLGAEYEAERLRRLADRHDRGDIPPWNQTSPAERRTYFDALDVAHHHGHPGDRVAEEYRGRPSEVIGRARELVDDSATRVREIPNKSTQIHQLHEAIDGLLDELRPPTDVVRHGPLSA